MVLLNAAIFVGDSAGLELPLRKIVLIYPCVFERGILSKECDRYIEILPEESYDPFEFEKTIFNVDTFCSINEEVANFKSRIRNLFENQLEGIFVDLIYYRNTPIIKTLWRSLETDGFKGLLEKVDQKLVPLR
jgi:hypothetical protein